MITPPKPSSRAGRIGVLRFLNLLRKDILSAQSPRLYRAKMAEFRTPFFRSYVINDPALLREVLQTRPDAFPKSPRMGAALEPLLGEGLFLAEGAEWARQTRMIVPLVEAEPRRAIPHIHWAAQAALQRLTTAHNPLTLDPFARRLTADVMFRVLFSRPITEDEAATLLRCFDAYEASAPLVSLGAMFPRFLGKPAGVKPQTAEAARALRKLVAQLVARHRLSWIKGRGQTDLVTRFLEARDPETGAPMGKVELVDQVTTLLLAGHETTATGLAWGLYLLALDPDTQALVAAEADAVLSDGQPDQGTLNQLVRARAVVRETLRLYPPLPMLVRETSCPERFRDRDIPQGAQLVVSPWHLHRHEDHWPDPDGFCPDRWSDPDQAEARRKAYLPFGAGPRACPGAGLALAEMTLILAMVCRDWTLAPAGDTPCPMARLTLRSVPPLQVVLTPRRQNAGTSTL